MGPVPLVQAVRSGVVEAVHRGSVAVVDAGGGLVASAGDPYAVTFARSSMKPLQAAVCMSLIGVDLPDEELAVMAASHNGEPVHVDAVDALLARADVARSALRTPPGAPLDSEVARMVEPQPVLHNCSGKHAGMLLACVRQGLEAATYPEPDHPLQRRIAEAVRTAAGDPVSVGVDGCGVPVHALPLASIARMFAGLASGTPEGADRVVAAMRAAPYLVGGRDRVCTALMRVADDLVVKVGAEGLICAALPARGVGIAVKIDDGAARAVAPAVVRVLGLLQALDGVPGSDLEPFARPPVLGGGMAVGELEPVFELRRG